TARAERPPFRGESPSSVRAGVRGRLALRRLLARRLAVLSRRAERARERGCDDRRQAATDQESDDLRAHERPPLYPPAAKLTMDAAERKRPTRKTSEIPGEDNEIPVIALRAPG